MDQSTFSWIVVWGLVALGLSLGIIWMLVTGVARGRYWRFERARQPVRYWALVSGYAATLCGIVRLLLALYGRGA